METVLAHAWVLLRHNNRLKSRNMLPVAYRVGGVGGSTLPPKFLRPSKIIPNSTYMWKLLKIAEIRTPTPQHVWQKGSKILKLPPVRNWFTLTMTNKLIVVINSLKVPKMKKILLYEMKFLVPNYSCLQDPWLGSYRPQIPVLPVLCPQLNLLNLSPPRTKFLGTPLHVTKSQALRYCKMTIRVWKKTRTSLGYRKLNQTTCKDSARTTQWTQFISVAKTSQLMLLSEIIAVLFSYTYKTHKYTVLVERRIVEHYNLWHTKKPLGFKGLRNYGRTNPQGDTVTVTLRVNSHYFTIRY